MSLEELDLLRCYKRYLIYHRTQKEEDVFKLKNYSIVKRYGISHERELNRNNFKYNIYPKIYPKVYSHGKEKKSFINRKIPECFLSMDPPDNVYSDAVIDDLNQKFYDERHIIEAFVSENGETWYPEYEPKIEDVKIPICYIHWVIDGERQISEVVKNDGNTYFVLYKNMVYEVNLSEIPHYILETVVYIPVHIEFEECFNVVNSRKEKTFPSLPEY